MTATHHDRSASRGLTLIGQRTSRGLTLIELAIVVAVLAIGAAAAVPSLAGLIELRRLDSAATQLAADLSLARGEAVARNRAVRVSIQASGATTCWIVHTGGAADCRCGAADDTAVCNAGAVVIKAVTLAGDLPVRVEANVASIRFEPLHGTATPTGTMRVTDRRGRAVHHIVNVIGRARSCSPGAAVPGWRAC